MEAPRWLASLAHLALVLSVPILVIVTPLLVFITPGISRYEYSRPGFPPSERFNPVERLRISDAILRYLRGNETLESMSAVKTDAGEVALKPDEVQHLVDVKGVVDGFFRAYNIALLLAPLSAILLWNAGRRREICTCLRQGVWIVAGLGLLVLVSSLIDFDMFFTRFHQVFFKPGTWVFYEEDTLIQLYPLPFWIDIVWKLAVAILAGSAIVYVGSIALERASWMR